MRTGSGSSATSDLSPSSCYYNLVIGKNPIRQRIPKINSNSNDIKIDDRQPLPLHSVGGYVDDLMERIRKMPPKKRSKFYQMLDEERLRDLNNNNNNNHDQHRKTKQIECNDNNNNNNNNNNDNERISTNTARSLMVSEFNSDEDEDRTLIEISSNSSTIDDIEQDKSNQPNMEFNDKNFEELLSMGAPLTVLKAIALQQQQQQQQQAQSFYNNTQLSNFLTNKCTVSQTNSPSDNKCLLNARTILQRLLQQQQHSTNDKSLPEPMDYTIDEETGTIEADDNEHHVILTTPRHRNGVRSNSHNPVTAMVNTNNITSLSPPTSTSSSSDQTDVNHRSSPTSLSRPSSTPATLVSSTCSV